MRHIYSPIANRIKTRKDLAFNESQLFARGTGIIEQRHHVKTLATRCHDYFLKGNATISGFLTKKAGHPRGVLEIFLNFIKNFILPIRIFVPSLVTWVVANGAVAPRLKRTQTLLFSLVVKRNAIITVKICDMFKCLRSSEAGKHGTS